MFDFDDANRKSKQAMDTMLNGYVDIAKGCQSIADEATDFSRRSYEEMASFMEQLATARSLGEVYQLQTRYLTSAYEAFLSQANKMNGLCADLTRSAYKPHDLAPAMSTSTAVVAADAA